MHAHVQGVVLNISMVCTCMVCFHMEACSRVAELLTLIVLLPGQHLEMGCFVPAQQQLADVMKEIAS